MELQRECVYCGSTNNLTTDHLIPRNKGGDDSADNVVLACQSCNSSRSDKGIFEWLGLKEKDRLHRLLQGNTLNSYWHCMRQPERVIYPKRNLLTCARDASCPVYADSGK